MNLSGPNKCTFVYTSAMPYLKQIGPLDSAVAPSFANRFTHAEKTPQSCPRLISNLNDDILFERRTKSESNDSYSKVLESLSASVSQELPEWSEFLKTSPQLFAVEGKKFLEANPVQLPKGSNETLPCCNCRRGSVDSNASTAYTGVSFGSLLYANFEKNSDTNIEDDNSSDYFAFSDDDTLFMQQINAAGNVLDFSPQCVSGNSATTANNQNILDYSVSETQPTAARHSNIVKEKPALIDPYNVDYGHIQQTYTFPSPEMTQLSSWKSTSNKENTYGADKQSPSIYDSKYGVFAFPFTLPSLDENKGHFKANQSYVQSPKVKKKRGRKPKVKVNIQAAMEISGKQASFGDSQAASAIGGSMQYLNSAPPCYDNGFEQNQNRSQSRGAAADARLKMHCTPFSLPSSPHIDMLSHAHSATSYGSLPFPHSFGGTNDLDYLYGNRADSFAYSETSSLSPAFCKLSVLEAQMPVSSGRSLSMATAASNQSAGNGVISSANRATKTKKWHWQKVSHKMVTVNPNQSDGYQWRSNGNRRECGRRYFRCRNYQTHKCPVTKLIKEQGDGSFLMEYHGVHLSACEQQKLEKLNSMKSII